LPKLREVNTMTDEIKLPPLPDTGWIVAGVGYTEAALQGYARQAIEAYKAQQQGEAEPVARIKGTEVLGLPLLEWLSADHSFRAPVGSLLYTHPAPAQQPLTDEQEREAFEDWAGPITALAKENGKYVEVMTSLAWEAWKARSANNIGAKP
jgi:hypothetical protein